MFRYIYMYLREIFNQYYFLYGFCIGILLVLLFKPKQKVLIQYPTPFNAGHITYKDHLNQCYKLRSIRTKCSSNNQKVSPQI